jgi:mono/diheme cytochrome c family protein
MRPFSLHGASAGALVLAAALYALPAGASPLGPASPAVKPPPGKILFVAACGSCHTLAAARTRGRTGGDLGEEHRSALEIAARIRRGGEGMPSFARTLRPLQIRQIAAFVELATRGSHEDR